MAAKNNLVRISENWTSIHISKTKMEIPIGEKKKITSCTPTKMQGSEKSLRFIPYHGKTWSRIGLRHIFHNWTDEPPLPKEVVSGKNVVWDNLVSECTPLRLNGCPKSFMSTQMETTRTWTKFSRGFKVGQIVEESEKTFQFYKAE